MPTEPDPWPDFMADLGVDDKPSPAQSAERRETFLGGIPTGDISAMPADDESDADDTAEGTEAGEGELDEDGQPKRRRRRRRRGRGRKGELGGESEPADGDDAPMPAGGEPIVLEAPAAYDAEGGDYDTEELQPETPDSDAGRAAGDYGVEDASPAATRELIADWNVPSWQTIVAGLYRPDR